MRSDIRHTFRQALLLCCLGALLVLVVPACGQTSGGTRVSQPPVAYAAERCTGQPVPTAMAAPPVAPAAVYAGSAGSVSSAGSMGGSLSAFSASDGSVRWCNRFVYASTTRFNGGVASYGPLIPPPLVGEPLLVANVVYVCVSGASSSNGATYAFNADDGALRWQRQTGCWIVSIPFGDYALPTLANGLLYTGRYALDPADGAIRWQMPLDATVAAVVDHTIYAYSQDTLYALAAGSGVLRWHYQLRAPLAAVPVVAGGRIYAGDINGDSPPAVTPGLPDAHALGTSSGKVVWSYPSGIVSSIAMDQAGGLVYFGSLSGLNALTATTGTLRWQYRTGSGSITTPVPAGHAVYFSADGAYAANALDGTLLWYSALGADQSTYSSPVTVLDGRVYVGQTDGSGNSTLYALSTSDGRVLWQVSGINQLSPPVAG
jgi:outer membrane protein assembly factor BamB